MAAALEVNNFNYLQREGSAYMEWRLEESSSLAFRLDALPGAGPGILPGLRGGGREDISIGAC